MINYSKYIYMLIGYIEGFLNFTVFQCVQDFDFDSEDYIAGSIDYKRRRIYVYEPTARGALLTLAHEAGHALAYIENRDKHFNREQRESLAYKYGYTLLKEIYADKFISKKDWKKFHREVLAVTK